MAWPGILFKIGSLLSPFLAKKVVESATRTVQAKADDFISKKRAEFVSQAKSEAERFVIEQIAFIETKVDTKIAEIERKIDEQIEKEVRNKLRILIYTLIAVILMSLVSLGYLYLKQRLGL